MVSARVLNGRVYRAACLPLLLALAIAGFSLSDRPAPLSASLAPEAFQGERAEGTLRAMRASYPERHPGSPGDERLARALAGELRALRATAGGGFAVAEHTIRAQTIDGSRTLTVVVASRPGTTREAPIAILARRDAAAGGSSGLSATATLMELARAFATSETRRGVVLVSTSGGSGGNAGARAFAEHAGQWVGAPLDAAIAIGDLGGSESSPLFMGTLAQTPGAAPELLRQTVALAIRQEAGFAARSPSLPQRLAQSIFPLAGGEQAPLDARGIPAVMLQSGGELPPAGAAPPGAARLEAVGRAVLAAVYALDAGPSVAGGGAPQTALALSHKLLPAWALRVLVAALLLPPLLTAGDGLARQRRRRRAGVESLRGMEPLRGGKPLWEAEPLRAAELQSVTHWARWVAACALPFAAGALVAMLCGWLGALPIPYPPVTAAALGLRGSALVCVLLVALVVVLAWWRWPALLRRLELPVRPRTDPAGLALVLVMGALALVVWALNPYTALLLVPALHLWLLLAEPERARSGGWAAGRVGALALVALGAAPLAALIVFYAHQLGLGPGGVAHTALLLLAAGRVGLAGAALWSVALGCLTAALLLALVADPGGRLDLGEPAEALPAEAPPPIRGPMSYAGPGSLGGTESALRR